MRVQLAKAKVFRDRVVEYTLTDGRKIQRDFSLVTGGVFNSKRWTDPKNFAKATVKGGDPCWPGERDFCPDVILRGGLRGRVPQSSRSLDTARTVDACSGEWRASRP